MIAEFPTDIRQVHPCFAIVKYWVGKFHFRSLIKLGEGVLGETDDLKVNLRT